jgi:membrane protease subunit HflC
MKRNPLTLAIGLLLILIFALLLFVFQVRTTEVAVVTTFGKPTRPITKPGAYLKWPWPIQRVYKFDQRVQNFEDKLTECLTTNSFNLLTSVYVGWRVSDPAAFFPKFAGSSDPMRAAEQDLDRIIGQAKVGAIGKHPLSDFLSASEEGNKFVEIEEQILKSGQAQLKDNNYGITIEHLGFKRVQLPEGVTQSVFERMTAERKALADRSQFQGEAEAQKIRSAAERQAAELMANAESEATRIRGEGEAEAAKSLAVFRQNPDLANFIFRLNALEASLKNRAVLVFDQNTPPFDLLRGASTNLFSK